MVATSSTPKRVALSTAQFDESLGFYIEKVKPDPLAKRQVEGWTCEWKEEDETVFHVSDCVASCRTGMATPTASADDEVDSNQSTPTPCCIHGTLSIHGAYMTVLLRANCHWTLDGTTENGSLTFTLSVRARFRTKAELRAHTTAPSDTAIDKKLRAKVLKRLQTDDYITKLLGDEFQPVCQATILTTTDQLEERVWMDQDLLESIQRTIYSQASSLIDTVELVASFPYLGNGCPLGHRAKLRLLEDAMLIACEQEEDDDLIDELSLQSNDVEGSSEQVSKKSKLK